MSRSIKAIRKTGIFIAGMVVIIVGIILLPLPGPGMLIILGGLVILSTEFEWADRYVKKARAQLDKVTKRDKTKPKQ